MAKKRKQQTARKGRQRHQTGRSRPASADSEQERLQRELALELERMRRRAAEAQAPDTSPSRVAEIIAEDFEALPSPLGLVESLVKNGSVDHARAVVAATSARVPGSVTALTLASEAARMLDEDLAAAAYLLDQALEAQVDSIGLAALAEHALAGDDAVAAAELAREVLTTDPDHEIALRAFAQALQELDARRRSGRRLGRGARQVLADFADRSRLYQLRDALRELVDGQFAPHVAQTVGEWLVEAGLFDEQAVEIGPAGAVGTPSGDQEALVRLAIEFAWLVEPEEDGEPLDEPDDEEALTRALPPPETPLGALASDSRQAPAVIDAATDWWNTCSYGLWRIDDPRPAPGIWLTEIVTGKRRYVAFAPEQAEGLARWSVILGPIVALDGVWRTGGSFVSLRPSEADAAAALVASAASDLMRSVTGKRQRHTGRGRQPRPYGVLVDAEDSDPLYANLVAKLTGHLLPMILEGVMRRRRQGPRLTNMDGETTVLITAAVRLSADPEPALRGHPDFRRDDGEITWWGRRLTESERASLRAEAAAQFGALAPGDLEDEPRWLRGRLRRAGDRHELEVNSRERLEGLLSALRSAGLAPEIERESVIDPSADLPLSGAGPLPFGSSPRAVRLWSERWPDQPSTAMGGATPRAAARKRSGRPQLEALLRELEHDADLLERRGLPVPDFAALRATLGMQDWRP